MPEWTPSLSVYFVLGWALVSDDWKLRLIVLLPIGFGLGINVYDKFQRTALLGILATVLTVMLFNLIVRSTHRKAVAINLILIGLSIGLGYKVWSYNAEYINNSEARRTVESPLSKAEGVELSLPIPISVERYRWSMWRDSVELYWRNPVFGIGFQEQVVYRVYRGAGRFSKNNGPHEIRTLEDRAKIAAPISGPHNSYLNAIARIGTLGFLFLVLHGLAFVYLIAHKYYALAAFIFAQALYSMFNIGLEGPTRSALLLIAIGAALKLKPQCSEFLTLINPKLCAPPLK